MAKRHAEKFAEQAGAKETEKVLNLPTEWINRLKKQSDTLLELRSVFHAMFRQGFSHQSFIPSEIQHANTLFEEAAAVISDANKYEHLFSEERYQTESVQLTEIRNATTVLRQLLKAFIAPEAQPKLGIQRTSEEEAEHVMEIFCEITEYFSAQSKHRVMKVTSALSNAATSPEVFQRLTATLETIALEVTGYRYNLERIIQRLPTTEYVLEVEDEILEILEAIAQKIQHRANNVMVSAKTGPFYTLDSSKLLEKKQRTQVKRTWSQLTSA